MTAQLKNVPVSLELGVEILEKIYGVRTEPPTFEEILVTVAKRFDTSAARMTGKGQQQKVTRARQVAMYLCRSLLNLTLQDVGRRFGGRHHSTVLASEEKVESLMAEDPAFRLRVEGLVEAFE